MTASSGYQVEEKISPSNTFLASLSSRLRILAYSSSLARVLTARTVSSTTDPLICNMVVPPKGDFRAATALAEMGPGCLFGSIGPNVLQLCLWLGCGVQRSK